jgi:hypothetical protein
MLWSQVSLIFNCLLFYCVHTILLVRFCANLVANTSVISMVQAVWCGCLCLKSARMLSFQGQCFLSAISPSMRSWGSSDSGYLGMYETISAVCWCYVIRASPELDNVKVGRLSYYYLFWTIHGLGRIQQCLSHFSFPIVLFWLGTLRVGHCDDQINSWNLYHTMYYLAVVEHLDGLSSADS